MGFFSTTELASTFKKPLYALHRSYKYVKLENGLRTLLISDPECRATAAAVCVGAGSHSDLDELPGLAHFCEHMLFMGTNEFPNPLDFWTKLTSMGGNTNAYTMGDYTCVHFEVSMFDTLVGEELGLNYLMKNFSSFFRKPMFVETYMNMEVKSIDDEHQGNIVNDEKILYHGLRLLSSEEHPFHRFGTGTKATLSSKSTREYMIEYYENNFVSENMVLVLICPLSSNQLQKLAVTNFASIPKSEGLSQKSSSKKRRSKTGSRRFITTSIPSLISRDVTSKIFPTEVTGRLLHIKSEKASNVRLFLPIYNFENSFYESVWCSLLGDESLGSLCDYLKRVKKCVSSMYVYTQRLSKENKILVVDLEILKIFNLNLLIQTIWSFIDQILDPTLTDLTTVLHEYSRVFEYQAYFSTSDRSTVMDEAANYALSLMENRVQDLEYLVTGDSFIFHGDIQHFSIKTREVFNMLSLNVIILCNDANWDWSLNNLSKDPYYHFQYAITNLNYARTKESIPRFFILKQNPFIAMTHNGLDYQLNSSHYTMPYALEANNLVPNLIDFSMYHEIWHSQCSSFNVVTSFQICFSSIPNKPSSLVAIEIIVEYIGEHLRTSFYQAELALFSWGIFSNLVTTPSLTFEIRGPINGFLYFLKEFIVRVKSLILTFNLDYKKFVAMKLQLRQNYDDLQHGETNTTVVAVSMMALEQDIASIEERLEAIELLETSNLVHICDLILKDYKYAGILVTGGDKQFAAEVCKVINILTSHERIYLTKSMFNFTSSVTLRNGRNYDLMLENSSSEDPTDVIYYYIQLCPRQDERRIVAKFLAYHMNQTVRHQLRTRRQLGYLILSGIRINKLTIGLYILLNSASYNCSKILLEIEQALFEWEMQVLTMTNDQFQELYELFMKKQDREKPDTLPSNISAATKPTKQSDNYTAQKQHSANFESIMTKNYDFGRYEDFNYANNTDFKLEDVVNLFRERISIKSTQRATLSILVSSKKGKMKRNLEANKKIVQSLLSDRGYQLTSLQLTSLLHESNNNVSIVIQKLRNLGYKISTKQGHRLHKVLWTIKNFKENNLIKLERMQQICVARYGKAYQTNQVVLPHLRVRNVDEIHTEAKFINQNKHVSRSQGIYDHENEDTYDLNSLM